ncbi:MAG: hypothetical protein ACOX6E_04885 [Syntrophomonadaceae bacterium]|jgi:hypothetical protein
MRTLVATALTNAKGKEVYCAAKKVSNDQINIIRNSNRQTLESVGFTFIKLLSLDFPDIKGYAIFFEGHLDEMPAAINNIGKS